MGETAAHETSPHVDDPPLPRVRLGSKLAIKTTLARLIKETMAGKRDSADLSRLVNGLQVLFNMQAEIDRESGGEDEQDPYSPEQEAADEEVVRARGWKPASDAA